MPFGGKNFARVMLVLLALLGYLGALNYRRDDVPPGLNNDVAEEGVRGIQLFEAGRLEVINTHGFNRAGVPFGHSMETLYLYLVGFASCFVGSTPLAVHVTTWFFVTATVALLILVVRRMGPAVPAAVPLLLAVSSVWLFHYGRSGLRAVTAPLFLLAFALALDSVERRPDDRLHAVLCGAILGASLYGYTSARILPVAFVLYAVVTLLRREMAALRRERLRAWGLVVAGALVVSIPNLVACARDGKEFLARGSYVLPAHLQDAAWNFVGSLLLPLRYPEYAKAVAADHHFDGVSFGLTVAGLRPVHQLVGLAVLFGIAAAWRRRGETLPRLLLCLWGASLLALGMAGPSLTRWLIVLPVFLAFATIGIVPLLARPWLRRATVAALLLLTVSEGRAYFERLSRDPRSASEFAEAATDIGRRARELAEEDRAVLVIVAGNANVVNFLTHDDRFSVWISEFWHRAPDAREIPLQRTEPQVILVERHPGFTALGNLFATFARRETHPLFDEFVVDPAWDWQTFAPKEGPDSPVAGYLPVIPSTSSRITM
jgi:predicted alpha/beta hydrolase